MKQSLRKGFWATCLGAAISLAQPALSQQILLESEDGRTKISGTLLNFENQTYTMQTIFGVLEVASNTVVCVGEACPPLVEPPSTFSIGVATPGLDDVMTGLVAEYARSQNAEVVENAAEGSSRLLSLREDERTLAEITLTRVGAASALDDDLASAVDIALVDAVPGRGGDAGLVLGRDALVALVHPDNPVTRITREDLAAVLTGDITNWADLGGIDAAIELVLPPKETAAGRSMAGALTEVALKEGAETAVEQIPAQINSQPNALGISVHSARGTARPLDLAGICGTVTAPDDFSIRSGSYGLVTDTVILQGSRDLPVHAQQFLDHLSGDTSRQALVEAGFLMGNQVIARPIGAQGDYLANAMADARSARDLVALKQLFTDLEGAKQLSTVYRFGSNVMRGEPQHEALTVALSDYLGEMEPEQIELLVLGYADGLETGGRRVGLSRARAEHVRNLIEAALPELSDRIRTAGYEGLAPRGCNRSSSGRTLNRRVEIWIKRSGG